MFLSQQSNYRVILITDSSDSVKVNIDGSISFGKDIMDTFSDFLGYNFYSRRSMMPIVNEDSITTLVRTAALCKDLEFCIPMWKFIEEYIIVMAKSVETVLSGMLQDSFKMFIYESQLKHYLETVRNILESTNAKISGENESYFWINIMKKICSKFQEMSSIFISDEFQLEPNKLNEVKKESNQKLIIATVVVELKYQNELCVEHAICVNSFETTKALNMLLEQFKTIPDEKVRLFMRYFYEALFETGFYSQINEVSAHELQVILNDMAYSKEVSTKDLLKTVQEVVELRLKSIRTKKDKKLFYDALLVHGILSDLDHIYSTYNSEPFADFYHKFLSWIGADKIRLDKEIRLVIHDIERKLWTVPDDLLFKLINEVKVFLELTVDPVSRN
ncbi:unnamed protein product [Euphydryas editha]|uniref:Uncharacterized protein n=1 Tax=Euphydryas editha TaxID=104508 RepID=A0AAU9UR43_EUPED|nr:unnamed protein product [Euphydryas editha]